MGENISKKIYETNDIREYIAGKVRGAELKLEYSPKDNKINQKKRVFFKVYQNNQNGCVVNLVSLM